MNAPVVVTTTREVVTGREDMAVGRVDMAESAVIADMEVAREDTTTAVTVDMVVRLAREDMAESAVITSEEVAREDTATAATADMETVEDMATARVVRVDMAESAVTADMEVATVDTKDVRDAKELSAHPGKRFPSPLSPLSLLTWAISTSTPLTKTSRTSSKPNARSELSLTPTLTSPEVLRIRYYSNTGKLDYDTYSYVTFDDLAALQAAVQRDGQEFMGREIKVDVSSDKSKKEGGSASSNWTRDRDNRYPSL